MNNNGLFRLLKLITINALIVLLWGCQEVEVAGIDGSGKQPDIDPGTVISKHQPLIAQGAINGFGSVIVHGQRYNTDNAIFYRNGKPVPESSFEVGEMIAVSGYSDENGNLFAETVLFEVALTGVVSSYDPIAGIAFVMGQRVSLDAQTVVGRPLDTNFLEGENVTISGWLRDAEVLATSITPAATSAIQRVRGHIRVINPLKSVAVVGGLVIDYSQLSGPFDAQQGDMVLFEGQLVEWADNKVLHATTAINYATVLAQNNTVVKSATISGTVRNIEQERLWVNGVEVLLNANTTITPKTFGGLYSGDRVVIQGEPLGAKQLVAKQITIKSQIKTQTLHGAITDISAQNDSEQYLELDGRRILVNAQTAIVDLQVKHSRVNLETLYIGDYLVATVTQKETVTQDETVTQKEGGLTALLLKRTSQGVNDRKFDGTDPLPPYPWGFEFEPASTEPGENLLYAGKLLSVNTQNHRLALSVGEFIIRRPNPDTGSAPRKETLLLDTEGNEVKSSEIAQTLQALLQEDPNRTIWVHIQGDDNGDKKFIDRMSYRLDWQGRDITGEPQP